MNYEGIPYNFMILAVVAVAVFGGSCDRSAFGRRIYIVGGNPITARLVGINSDLVTIACYVISSCLAAIAGLILSGYVGLVDNWVGQGYRARLRSSLPSSAASRSRADAERLPAHWPGRRSSSSSAMKCCSSALPIQMQIIIKGAVIVHRGGILREAPAVPDKSRRIAS